MVAVAGASSTDRQTKKLDCLRLIASMYMNLTIANPMTYTLGQAAKATGISKPSLSAAIKKGRLSAIRLENGSFAIDPAELHRVYPPVSSNSNEVLTSEQFITHDLTAKIAVLEAQLKGMADLNGQVVAERDRLWLEQERLLAVIHEQAGTVKALTHQKPANENRPAVRGWLWVALALAITAAVIWGWLNASFFGLPLK